MPITKAQKTEILKELDDKFKRAKGIVFAQYRGFTVENNQSLRRGLREVNVDYKVAKKTLIKRAAKDAGVELPKEIMQGPIGVAFGYDDEIVAAQKMAEFAKKYEAIQLMGGIMEGRLIDAAMVKTLAAIPSRDVLLAKFMGSMMSPLQGFVGILNNVSGSFVRAVNAYREKLQESTPAAPEAPKAEETKPAEAPAAPEAKPEA